MASPHSILLVEDESIVRRVMVRRLSRAGYQVLEAESGAEALAHLAAGQKPDLLITDVVMRDMPGHEVAAKVRASNPTVKVLFVSGYPEHHLVERGILKEGDAFLEKGDVQEHFVDRVNALLAG